MKNSKEKGIYSFFIFFSFFTFYLYLVIRFRFMLIQLHNPSILFSIYGKQLLLSAIYDLYSRHTYNALKT